MNRLPAYAVNGISVGVGIALIEAVFALLVEGRAAQMLLAGAVCTSLASCVRTLLQ